jgi:hypothetical protein
MLDGISDNRDLLATRNLDAVETPTLAATAEEAEPSAATLNQIETAAGADGANDDFGDQFTNIAPKALADDPAPAAALPAADAKENGAN